MTEEKNRLRNMLKENKITKEEYTLLSASLDKKSSFAASLFWFLVNPFQKIAGFYALVTGLIIFICMCYFGVLANVYFPGILQVLNGVVVKNPKTPLSFQLLLYQIFVSWLVLVALFYIAAKIFQQKKLRLLDFFGTVALSRFPYLVMTIFTLIMRILEPTFMNLDITKGVQMHPSILASFVSIFIYFCVLWQIATYYYALKISSGLAGKKLWISFIVAILLGEAITQPLTSIFF